MNPVRYRCATLLLTVEGEFHAALPSRGFFVGGNTQSVSHLILANTCLPRRSQDWSMTPSGDCACFRPARERGVRHANGECGVFFLVAKKRNNAICRFRLCRIHAKKLRYSLFFASIKNTIIVTDLSAVS